MRITTACPAVLLLLLVSLFAAAPASAQADNTAQLRVIVVDQTNAGLPTATATITADGSTPVSVVSDEKGIAMFPTLAPGVAKVRAEFPGFDPYVGQVTLKRGPNNQTVTLNLGGVQEEVTVKA